jgi:hypothetical protein
MRLCTLRGELSKIRGGKFQNLVIAGFLRLRLPRIRCMGIAPIAVGRNEQSTKLNLRCRRLAPHPARNTVALANCLRLELANEIGHFIGRMNHKAVGLPSILVGYNPTKSFEQAHLNRNEPM